ncbi:MAG TPA: YncE family protein [Microvirga sp.]|jgi:DNA-binding beta-propeller fold protein YncE|nr:YncE family protein [Microvirga sp.]
MPDRGSLIVSGRWDDNVAIIDVAAALDPANDRTPRAILSRPRVTPDIVPVPGGPAVKASGQPVSVAVDPQGRTAYVVNHSGPTSPEAAGAYQHGHPGLVTVVDLARARDAVHDGTLGAVEGFIATGREGPVGCAITPDGGTLFVSVAEAAGSEDGGAEVTAIDLATRTVLRQIPLRETHGHEAAGPSPEDSPHPSYGRYPNPNGIVVSPRRGGLIFTGNGGTDDVAVLDLAGALAGAPDAEIGRVPVEAGPFAMALSPDGRLVAVTARESMRERREGRTISLVDVDRAATDPARAEVARVRIGSDDANEETRPFAVAFTPDGRHVIASCFRSNTVSLVEVEAALAGRPAEVLRLRPETPNGGPARPRGIVITPDGRHAAIVGGAKTGPRSSLVWFLDLASGAIVSTVTEVGNESYLLAGFRHA